MQKYRTTNVSYINNRLQINDKIIPIYETISSITLKKFFIQIDIVTV